MFHSDLLLLYIKLNQGGKPMATYTGTTVEKAIEIGLADLKLDRKAVTISTLVEPKKGFLGIGKRLAKIEISVPVDPKSKSNENKALKNDSEVQNKPDEANHETSAEVHESLHSNELAPSETHTARPRLNDAVVTELQNYLSEIVSQLGIEATATNKFHHREVSIEFKTEQEGMLIGKHGRTINALQTLAQVFLLHQGIAHVNVELNVENYRERRIETLQHLAENTAREVVATGEPVFLDPMPAFERKVIHAALADNHFVSTFSEGHEPHRYVVVALVQDEQI